MKMTKTASGRKITMSYNEWLLIGKKTGWTKEAGFWGATKGIGKGLYQGVKDFGGKVNEFRNMGAIQQNLDSATASLDKALKSLSDSTFKDQNQTDVKNKIMVDIQHLLNFSKTISQNFKSKTNSNAFTVVEDTPAAAPVQNAAPATQQAPVEETPPPLPTAGKEQYFEDTQRRTGKSKIKSIKS